MDKAMQIGQTSATGSFNLFIGKIVSTVILAVGTIIMQQYILEGDYGLYVIALIPATTLLLFQDWGINAALTRFCAQCRSSNNEEDLRKIIISGLSFEIATGLLLTLASVLMAQFIASVILNKPESTFLITLGSITILSMAVSGAIQSILIGLERMKLQSLLMIFRCSPGRWSDCPCILRYGAMGAIIGYTSI
jgi:O-antigen/teichoic acid export membrane protein